MLVVMQGLLEMVEVKHIGVIPVEKEQVFRVVAEGPVRETNINVAEYRTHEAAIKAFNGLIKAIESSAMVYIFPEDERAPEAAQPAKRPAGERRFKQAKDGTNGKMRDAE